MTNAEVFRPRSGYFLAGVMIAGSLLLVIQTLFYSRGEDLFATIGWAVTISIVSYWLFIHPKVVVFDEGITIRNPINEVTVSWADVDEIDVQYTMNISVGGKLIHAWAAPAPGRYHARTVHVNELKGMRLKSDNLLRPGESPRTYSGEAAQIARARYEAFIANPRERIESVVATPTRLLVAIGATTTAALALSIF